MEFVAFREGQCGAGSMIGQRERIEAHGRGIPLSRDWTLV